MLMTSTEAAKRLGICKRILLEKTNSGEIRNLVVNGRHLYRQEYLDE